MRCTSTVYNFNTLNKITNFSDFQSWMKGIENQTGTLKIKNIHDYNLLQTNFKLCNKEFAVEIVPIFPVLLSNQISQTIMYPDARPVIPISKIELLKTTTKLDNGLQRIVFFKRKISQLEIENCQVELDNCIQRKAFGVRSQIRFD